MKNTDEEKKKRPGDIHWEYLGVDRISSLDSTELVAAFIGYRNDYERESRRTCRPAFEALALIVREYILRPKKPDPDGLVRIPWWVAEAIGNAWVDYIDLKAVKPFGECAGLEGGGQGKRPALRKAATRSKHWNLANDVAATLDKAKNGQDQEMSVETAINEVAERCGVSDATVWKAYKKYGEEALKLLPGAKAYYGSLITGEAQDE